ncbi:MAG TPA: hypothetical protein VK090_04310, partial [Paracoccaceae bacterium]|nr:hypothetical protein [Paracoccaceae bacterium]
VFVDDMAGPEVAEKVERRLRHWLGRRVNALFEPMLAMRDDEAITGLARGVAYRLAENFGIIPRRDIAGDIKALEQADRAALRKHGVRFGQHFIFMPALLKPAPTRLRLLLWSLAQALEDFPDAPPPGHVTVPVAKETQEGYYHMAGYRPAGQRAVRIDMLERLADLIRPMDARAGFEATPDMLSITGLGHEAFAELMAGLGYQVEKGERPKEAKPARAEEAGSDGAPATGTEQAAGATDAADTPAGAEDHAAKPGDVADDAETEGAAPAASATDAAAELVAEELSRQGIAPLSAPDALEAEEAAEIATALNAPEEPRAEGGPEVEGTIIDPPEASEAHPVEAVREAVIEGAGTAGHRFGDGDQLASQPGGAEAGMPPADPVLEENVAPRDRQEKGATTPAGTTAPEVTTPEVTGPDAGRLESGGEGVSAEKTGAVDAAGTSSDAEHGQAPDAALSAADKTNEATAEAGASGSAEGTAGADAVELETFYIFRFQPRNRGPRRGSARPGSGASAPVRSGGRNKGGTDRGDAAGEGGERRGKARGERPSRSGSGSGGKQAGGKGDRANAKGPKGRGPRQENAGKSPRTYVSRPSGAERATREIDPDNPFAVLQQLKKN